MNIINDEYIHIILNVDVEDLYNLYYTDKKFHRLLSTQYVLDLLANQYDVNPSDSFLILYKKIVVKYYTLDELIKLYHSNDEWALFLDRPEIINQIMEKYHLNKLTGFNNPSFKSLIYTLYFNFPSVYSYYHMKYRL